jgi:diaminopimelate epimerase
MGAAGLPQGEVELDGRRLALAAAGMGNPHVVVTVDDLDQIPFERWGAALEVDPLFPAKTNVHFLQVLSPSRLQIRVWERGAGPTLACGTGACATLVAAHLLGLAEATAEVLLPGGPLTISWPDRSGSILMTGPAEAVFDGVLVPELVPADGPADPVVPEAEAPIPAAAPARSLDCARDCSDTCQQPERCLREEAQKEVQSLLSSMSLDAMINLAGESLEQRTRARMDRDRGA